MREQVRLIDLGLSLLSLLPLTLPLTTLLPPTLLSSSPLPLLPLLSPLTSPPHLPTLTGHWWLLLYAATLTWTDVQYQLIQRVNAHLHRTRRGTGRRDGGQAGARGVGADGGGGAEWGEDEGARGVEGEGEEEGRAGEEEEEGGDEVEEEQIEAEDGFHDEDLRFQRRLLRRGEAILRARALPLPPSSPPAPPLTDAEWLSLTSAIKATLSREQGAPLPLLLLTDLLSALRCELWSRALLPPLLFLLFLCWTFSLRYFLLLDALRLIIEGLIPLIPLLAITRSLLYPPHTHHPPHPPSPFSLLVDSLNRPSVIVGLRSLGLGITLAINGGHWKAVMKRLCDRLLLPLMDIGTGRMIRVRRGGGEWVSPFVIAGWEGRKEVGGGGGGGGGAGGDGEWETAEVDEAASLRPQLTGSAVALLLDHAQHWGRVVTEVWGRLSVGSVVSLSSVSFRVLCRLLLLPSFTLRSLLVLLLSPTRLSHAALLSLRSVCSACASYFEPTLRLSSSSTRKLIHIVRRPWGGAFLTLPFPTLLSPGSPYLPSPSSSHRLFALALFMSQVYSRDDSRAWLLTPTSLLQSVGRGLHHWCLSIVWLRVSLTAGLPTSIALHALFNCTSTITRYLTLSA